MEKLVEKIEAFLSLSIGCGDGMGYGSGYGRGDGSGDGSGYGSGYGSGCGIYVFDGHKVYNVDGIPTCIEQVHGNYAIGFTFPDFSRKKCYIAKVDNCFAHGDTLRDAVNDATAKALKAKPVEERIKEVVKLHPYPTVPVSNKELFELHNTLTGSCEFGRMQFCKQHGISLDDSMTMADFCKITANEYGEKVIRQLAEAYGLKKTNKHSL